MSAWAPIREVPELRGRDVHVWRVGLRVGPEREMSLRATLSPDELVRADRFLFGHSREQSIVSRASLRRLLGAYCAVDPADLHFRYGAAGRPLLDGVAGPAFNVSHSRDLALLAFTREGELGIDVERVEPARDLCKIAVRYFSAAERATLGSLSDDELPLGFYRCWTRKEAYLKARGTGLSLPLDAFDVTLGPDDPPRLVATRFDPPDQVEWNLTELRPADGYVGALITSGASARDVSFMELAHRGR